jgi:hypothetical protein
MDQAAQQTPVPVSDETGAPRDRSIVSRARAAWASPLTRYWLSWVLPVVCWAAASAFLYSRVLARPTAQVPGGADGVIYVWFFDEVEQSLAHLHNPLLSHAMNAPSGVSTMWNAAALLPAIVLAPLTAAIGPVATVGLAMVVCPVLAAFTAYFAFRRITGKATGSFLGATLYGFGPFFVGQSGHLHLTAAAALLPLILLVGYRIFVTQDGNPVWAGVWLGLLTAALFLTAEEVLVMGAAAAVVAVLWLAALRWTEIRAHARYALHAVGVGVGVTLVLVAYPLWYQLYGPLALHRLVTHRSALDVASFVRPSALQYFSTATDRAANRNFSIVGSENTGYLGIPILILIASFLVWRGVKRDVFAVWWLGTAAVVWSFSLGTRVRLNGHRSDVPGTWAAITHIKELKNVVASRFSSLVALFIGLLIAWVLARLAGRAYLAVTAATAVALVSLLPAGRYDDLTDIRTPAFFSGPGAHRIPAGATVLALPNASGPNSDAQVMFWQVKAHLRFKIIGGYGIFSDHGNWSYFGNVPRFAAMLNHAGQTGDVPGPLKLAAATGSLRRSGPLYIVITDQLPHPGSATHAAERLTGCRPQHVTDVTICAVAGS